MFFPPDQSRGLAHHERSALGWITSRPLRERRAQGRGILLTTHFSGADPRYSADPACPFGVTGGWVGLVTSATRPRKAIARFVPILGTVVMALNGCSGSTGELPPPVGSARAFPLPIACVGEPPMAPWTEPIERASQPQVCLQTSDELLLTLTVVDGRVSSFDAHTHVDRRGRLVPVLSDPVRNCLISKFASWRFPATLCPGHPSKSAIPIALRPTLLGAQGAEIAIARPDPVEPRRKQ